jgi:hypothetical protein
MIASDDGLDTALARVLYSRGAMDLATLQAVLSRVREERGLVGATLAGVLRERDLVPSSLLEEALREASSSLGGPAPTDAEDKGAQRNLPELSAYRVLRELARGGMGAVYEVEHESGARFALKTLLPGGLTLDEHVQQEERTRFEREGEALAMLNHPHVVRIHAADLSGRVPYMIQDLLPGGTLEARLRQGPLPWEEAVSLTLKLCRGLAHAHARGLLHRDLKPLNVLFDDRGEPRLVDFGLVRSLGGSSLTQTGQLLGTPAYMAPEQALGSEVDVRADVYGMGGILYALLCGRPPFEGGGLGILAAVVNDMPPTPSSLGVQLPEWVEAVCMRALAKSDSARYESAEAMAAALAQGSERLPPSSARRRRALALAVLVAGVIGVVASTLSWWIAEQRRSAALEDVRRALRGSVAGIRSGLAEWTPRWDTPPAELVLARGLVAIDDEDAATVEECLSQLAGLEAPPEFGRALSGGLAFLAEGPNPAGARLLRRARRDLVLEDLAVWEAELRLRSSSDTERLAVLRLFGSIEGTPRNAREIRVLRRAVFEWEKVPLPSLPARVQAIPELSGVLASWALLRGLRRGGPADLAARVGELPSRLPVCVRGTILACAREVWQPRMVKLVSSPPLTPGSSVSSLSALDASAYEELTLWIQILRSLCLLEDLPGALDSLLRHARSVAAAPQNVGGRTKAELIEAEPHVAAMAGFFLQLVSLRPRDMGLVRNLFSVITKAHWDTQAEFSSCLAELDRASLPGIGRAARLFECYMEVRAQRLRERTDTGRATMRRVLAALAPLQDDPPEFDSHEALSYLKKYDPQGLLSWTTGYAHDYLGQTTEALRSFRTLAELGPAGSSRLPPWQPTPLAIRYSLARIAPLATRKSALHEIAQAALLESETHNRANLNPNPGHLGGLLIAAWEQRGLLNPLDRRRLQELVATFDHATPKAQLEWILRRVICLLEVRPPRRREAGQILRGCVVVLKERLGPRRALELAHLADELSKGGTENLAPALEEMKKLLREHQLWSRTR